MNNPSASSTNTTSRAKAEGPCLNRGGGVSAIAGMKWTSTHVKKDCPICPYDPAPCLNRVPRRSTDLLQSTLEGRFFSEQTVNIVDQGPAAGQHHAAVRNVGPQFRRGMLKRNFDLRDDLV